VLVDVVHTPGHTEDSVCLLVRDLRRGDEPWFAPETRAWSQAAYLQRPAARAVGYGSRRNDSGRCLMLFKQRLADPPFTVVEEQCLATPPLRKEVLELVRSLGIGEV